MVVYLLLAQGNFLSQAPYDPEVTILPKQPFLGQPGFGGEIHAELQFAVSPTLGREVGHALLILRHNISSAPLKYTTLPTNPTGPAHDQYHSRQSVPPLHHPEPKTPKWDRIFACCDGCKIVTSEGSTMPCCGCGVGEVSEV